MNHHVKNNHFETKHVAHLKCYILYNCLILIVLLSLCVLRNKGYHTTNKLRVASPPTSPAWQE
uniref:Ovule protein n=1 Tax=Heterorhabditis bacteriophora TaxID=37862 RepID=A0A1I7WBD6_HETBA